MKELDSFTVERLGEIKNAFLDCNKETAPSIGEIFTLIDIALAAKRAEPDYYIVRLKFNDGWGDELVLDTYETELDATKSKADHGGEIIPAYTTPQLNSQVALGSWINCIDQMPIVATPQLNSPEIPEGWKLVPNMPTLGMLSVLGLTGSFESMLGRYADMLYAAPEKENG